MVDHKSLTIILIIIFIQSSATFHQNSLTYRFTEYVIENGHKVGWNCQCPPLNEDNLCLCHKEGVTSEPVSIESPYAAILIQADHDTLNAYNVSKVSNDDWGPEYVQLNMAGVNGVDVKVSRYVRRDEPIFQKVKLMPRDDLTVRYLRSTGNKNPEKMSEFSYRMVQTKDSSPADVVIIIPGWQSSIDTLHSILVTSVYQTRLIVDWLDGNQFFLQENERIYEQVVANTIYVGYHLGTYLKEAKARNVFKDIHIIGFDIGSYVAHFAAKVMNEETRDSGFGEGMFEPSTSNKNPERIKRITALDPPRYLFEDDPLSTNDADYVEIYHSNVGYEKDGSFDLVKSLLNRRFGESRQLGHASIFINLKNPADIYSGHSHPQCVPENGDNNPVFGCPSLMAARFFIDSIKKKSDFMEFMATQIGNRMNRIKFGYYVSLLPIPTGSFHVKYDQSVCSTSSVPQLILPNKMSKQDIEKYIFPNESISSRRVKVIPPIEEPSSINKVNEENANCGQFNNNLNYSSRVFEGRNATDNQFNFVVCIEPQKVLLWKYKYILVNNLLYLRPSFYEPAVYSRYDRVARADLAAKRFTAKNFQISCTGSLIDSVNGWILTAAHCFGTVINGIQMRFTIGSANCHGNDDKKIVIRTEKDENKINQNIFIHPNTINAWDETFNNFIDEMSATKYGRLLTDADFDTYKFAKGDDLNKFTTKWTKQEVELYGEQGKKPKKVKIKTDDDCVPKVKVTEKDAKDFNPEKVWKSDIALIKIPTDKLSNFPASNQICYKSAINFDYHNFNQFFYYAGYGNKGKKKGTKTTDDWYLSWLTNLNKAELANRFNNTITLEYASLGFPTKSDQIKVGNVDQTNDDTKIFISTNTCPGDSGGPHFVYANSNGAKYTLLVGVHTGGGKWKTMGDVIAFRGTAPGDHYCAEQLRYNVYAKRFFKNPTKFTMVTKYLDWIDNTINPEPKEPPAKKTKTDSSE